MTPEAGAAQTCRRMGAGSGLFLCAETEGKPMAIYGAKYLQWAKKMTAGVVGESVPT